MESKIILTIVKIFLIAGILLNLVSVILLCVEYYDTGEITRLLEASILLLLALICAFGLYNFLKISSSIDGTKFFRITDQYGESVIVLEIKGNMIKTNNGTYHASKLFINGESLQTILDKQSW
jgi:hypothetical protein